MTLSLLEQTLCANVADSLHLHSVDFSCKEREIFYKDVRSCRRRQQNDPAQTTISRIFTTPDEYHLLQYRATIARIRSSLIAKKMYLLDAFRAFDSDRNGLIGSSELYGGLEWLGLHLTPDEVHDMVREIDTENTGYINYEEFKKALLDPDNPEGDVLLNPTGASSTGDGADGTVDFEHIVIAPKRIRELNEKEAGEEAKPVRRGVARGRIYCVWSFLRVCMRVKCVIVCSLQLHVFQSGFLSVGGRGGAARYSIHSRQVCKLHQGA